MKPYFLHGQTDLFSDALWGGNDKFIFLPDYPEINSIAKPIFWVTDENGKKQPLIWAGGTALDYETTFSKLSQWAVFNIPRPLMSFLPFHPHRLPPRARAWSIALSIF